MSLMTASYPNWLEGMSARYRASQIKAAIAVNSEMLRFYWSLGADIVRMEADQPWGSKFIAHLSEDLRREMPEAKCFSVTNLKYIRQFFKLYAHKPIGQQVVGQFQEDIEGVTTPIGIADYALEKFLPADFVSDLPEVDAIETDQTRRLQLLLRQRKSAARTPCGIGEKLL